MTLLRSEAPKLSRTAQLSLAENLVDYWGGGIFLMAKIQPVNGNNAETLSAAVDTRKFRFFMAVVQVGVIDQTVDVVVKESVSSGGSYAAITGKSATQIAGTGDGGSKIIFFRDSELTSGNHFAKLSITVANGTSSLVSGAIYGIDPLTEVGTSIDDSGVSEILGGSAYTGAKYYFITNVSVPEPDADVGDFTISALNASGTALDAWEGPVSLPGGRVGMHHNVSAIAGADPTQETLTGVLVLDYTGLVVLHVEEFPELVEVTQEGDGPVFEMVIPITSTLTTGLTN